MILEDIHTTVSKKLTVRNLFIPPTVSKKRVTRKVRPLLCEVLLARPTCWPDQLLAAHIFFCFLANHASNILQQTIVNCAALGCPPPLLSQVKEPGALISTDTSLSRPAETGCCCGCRRSCSSSSCCCSCSCSCCCCSCSCWCGG